MRFIVLKNKKNGFTLIETIIYISLVSLIFLIIIEALMLVVKSNKNSFNEINIKNAGYSAMQAMTREIRSSEDIENIFSNGIELKQKKGEIIVKFSISSESVLNFYEGTDELILVGPLTPRNILVKNLIFNEINTQKTKAVRIQMELESNIEGIVKNEWFYSTIILRGSYKNDY